MRPKLKLHPKAPDIVMEVVCAAVLLFIIIYLIHSWSVLPDTIPTHFGLSGKADRYGSKTSLIFLIPVVFILYLGLTVIQRFPHIYNYLPESRKDAEFQYTTLSE